MPTIELDCSFIIMWQFSTKDISILCYGNKETVVALRLNINPSFARFHWRLYGDRKEDGFSLDGQDRQKIITLGNVMVSS